MSIFHKDPAEQYREGKAAIAEGIRQGHEAEAQLAQWASGPSAEALAEARKERTAAMVASGQAIRAQRLQEIAALKNVRSQAAGIANQATADRDAALRQPEPNLDAAVVAQIRASAADEIVAITDNEGTRRFGAGAWRH